MLLKTLLLLLLYFSQVFDVISAGILYPRASNTREVQSLDGLWQFRISPKPDPEAGFRQKWFLAPLQESMLMPVPSSFNDITTSVDIRDFVGWAWYQRTFYVPIRWHRENQRVFIRFGSVHYNARFWVNGQMAGAHEGGHLPFQAEVTSILRYGTENQITVAVNNTLTQQTIPQGMVTRPNDTDKYPPGYILYSYNFDFFNYAGIHRPVLLYTVPSVHIDDITIRTDVQDSTVGIVEYEVIINMNGNAVPSPSSRCQARLLDASRAVKAASHGCTGVLRLEGAKLWWPVGMHNSVGYLYILQITHSSGDIQDLYEMKIGIRKLTWSHKGIQINGKPVYLMGVGKHEDSSIRGKGLDLPVLIRDYELLKWLGANSYRTSHYPYAEEALDLADCHGIMIILESPAVNLDNFDEQLLRRHLSVLEEMVKRDKNRASVIIWSISNEAKTSKKAAGPYYKAAVHRLRQLDKTRAISYVTNQDLNKDEAAQYMDIIGVNRYFGWYHDIGQLDLIGHQIESEITDWYNTFNKSVYVSEYGAGAISGFHTLPSEAWTEDYQVALLKQHFKAFNRLKKSGILIGEMIWNFADFATRQDSRRALGNHKGLFTRERQPKASARVVKSRYQNIANNIER